MLREGISPWIEKIEPAPQRGGLGNELVVVCNDISLKYCCLLIETVCHIKSDERIVPPVYKAVTCLLKDQPRIHTMVIHEICLLLDQQMDSFIGAVLQMRRRRGESKAMFVLVEILYHPSEILISQFCCAYDHESLGSERFAQPLAC